jgi:hypothetical protein
MVERVNRQKDNRRSKINSNPYSRKQTSSERISINIAAVDDVIVSLANAHENRRARQVTEWERLLRQNMH